MMIPKRHDNQEEVVALALVNADMQQLDLPPLLTFAEFRSAADAEHYLIRARAALAAAQAYNRGCIAHRN